MKPVPEWRRVLRHAWSVRANIAVAVISAAGGAFSMINGDSIGHPLLIPAVAFACTAIGSVGSILLRILQQKHLPGAM
jgi:hypothetical protein